MRHTVTEVVLKNGARGLLVDVPEAVVMSFEINFRAGDYLAEEKKWETAHLMEHILLGANELIRKARHFQAEFEKNGAYCNASTGSYEITYEAECADFEWDRIIDLLTVAITKPLFLKDEFDAEFGNVREELSSRSNNHFRHLSLALRQRYGFRAKTDQERITLMDNVGLEDVKNHYKRTHKTENMRFIIVGRLSADRKNTLSGLLENIELASGGERFEVPDEMPQKSKEPLYINNSSVSNLYFIIDTFIKRRITDDESDALKLANMMLTETLHSKILGTARERGLVYGMGSGQSLTLGSSNWWFGSQVMPKNAPELFEIIVRELETFFAGKLNAQDVEDAKQYALGRFQRSAQTVSGISSYYANRYFFDDVIMHHSKIPERIQAVTKDRVVDIANKMFKTDTYGLGVLGSSGPEFVRQLEDKIDVLWNPEINPNL
jgi:predicted Zn-dependent peptidase